MSDFQNSLMPSTGRPYLWPYHPKWTSDPAFKSKMAKIARLPPHLLEPSCQQVFLDNRHRHLLYLIETTFSTEQEHTPEQWATLLLEPSGWQWSQQVTGKGTMTANEFCIAYQNSGQQALSSNYIHPIPPIPRTCDHCKKVCESVCDCGEAYCSQLCQKQAWKNHCKICAQVFENGTLRSTMNRLEMQDTLSRQEMGKAQGNISQQYQYIIIDGARIKKLNGRHGLVEGMPSNPTQNSLCAILLLDSKDDVPRVTEIISKLIALQKRGNVSNRDVAQHFSSGRINSVKVKLKAIVPVSVEELLKERGPLVAVKKVQHDVPSKVCIQQCHYEECERTTRENGAKGAKLMSCPCQTAQYCSKEHQRLAYPEHKTACKRLRKEIKKNKKHTL